MITVGVAALIGIAVVATAASVTNVDRSETPKKDGPAVVAIGARMSHRTPAANELRSPVLGTLPAAPAGRGLALPGLVAAGPALSVGVATHDPARPRGPPSFLA